MNPLAVPLLGEFGSVEIQASQFLGYVEAPDRAAAEVAAVRAFNLSKEQRKRLLVRERG